MDHRESSVILYLDTSDLSDLHLGEWLFRVESNVRTRIDLPVPPGLRRNEAALAAALREVDLVDRACQSRKSNTTR
jgi:hypothetical protein